MPLIIGGALALGGAVAQGVAGSNQKKKGQKILDNLEEPTTPKYTIPTEYTQNLTDAQKMALEGLPEAQKRYYQQNVSRMQSQFLNALGSRKAGLAGVEGLAQQGNDQQMQLLSADAQARTQNKRYLNQVRSALGAQKEKQFNINKMLPYEQQMKDYYAKQQEGEGLIGAGTKNIAGAFGTAGQLGMSVLGGGFNLKNKEG